MIEPGNLLLVQDLEKVDFMLRMLGVPYSDGTVQPHFQGHKLFRQQEHPHGAAIWVDLSTDPEYLMIRGFCDSVVEEGKKYYTGKLGVNLEALAGLETYYPNIVLVRDTSYKSYPMGCLFVSHLEANCFFISINDLHSKLCQGGEELQKKLLEILSQEFGDHVYDLNSRDEYAEFRNSLKPNIHYIYSAIRR